MEEIQNSENTRKEKFQRLVTIAKGLAAETLPFVMVALLVWGVYFAWNSLYEEDEQTDQHTEIRQEALEQNWMDFLSRDPGQDPPVDLNRFELSLCPFAEEFREDTTPEEEGMICGYITSPQDHHHPEKGSLRIPIAIWPNDDNNFVYDPLFVTQGGPGGSTLDGHPAAFFSSSLGGGIHDVVFVDQRGTRYAEPSLVCPEEQDKWLDGTSNKNKENIDNFVGLRACRNRIEKEGIDLSVFTTEQIARDFEVVRQILGYEEINFYGVSYGSHVGQYLAALYPDSVRSLILDGVAPLPLDYLNRSLISHEQALNKLESSCIEDADCHKQYPEMINQLDRILVRYEQNPSQITFSDPDSSAEITEDVTGEELYSLIIFSFYLEHGYASIPFLISQMERNHLEFYQYLGEWIAFEEVNASGLFYSVVCSEHTPWTAVEKKQNLPLTNMFQWEAEHQKDTIEECEIWDVNRAPSKLEEMPVSDVPTLLLSGSFDPVTPPEYGDIALHSFPQGQHIVDPLGGHGIAFTDACTVAILEHFLKHPDQEVDASCLSEPSRRQKIIPPGAFPSPYLKNLNNSSSVVAALIALPILKIVSMFMGGVLMYIRYLWKSARKTLPELPENVSRQNLRFELASWVFIIAYFGFAFSSSLFFNQALDKPAYLNVIALPGGIRTAFLIPPLLILVLIAQVSSIPILWKHNKNIFGRFSYLVQIVFSLGIIAGLWHLNLIVPWIRFPF